MNRGSGRGRGGVAADQFAAALRRAGRAVSCIGDVAALPGALSGAEALVVVGGDGTVRAAAPAAITAAVPVYHVPMGTVNLFARALGMDRREATLLAALEQRDIRCVDVGQAGGETFLLMASIGPDAEVVRDLAGRRTGAISRRSYVLPMWRRLRAWRPPSLAVTVDGRRVDRGEPGMVIVANCRGYMWGLDPARRAVMNDGLLDVVIMPVRSRLDLVRWAGRCLTGRHLAHPGLVYERGRKIAIGCDTPQHVQLDGDSSSRGATGPRAPLEIAIRPAALAVLSVRPDIA